jgi:peptidoglycan/xylan/chitin deacetylase (PgdA/CDA1 family)
MNLELDQKRQQKSKKSMVYLGLFASLSSVALLTCLFLHFGGNLESEPSIPSENQPSPHSLLEGVSNEELGQEDLAQLGVNELGEIMIIMYHDVQDYEAEWVRSRENFKKDLERFYHLGYSLIPLKSYLTGNIQVPAGKTPLVLTFDDGTYGQFNMISDESTGEMVVNPECAVGILLQFGEEHPEFGHAATFFINSGNPFGDASRIFENLTFLLENGMEIGNHTRTHINLSYASTEDMFKEIGWLANEVRDLCDYEVTALALPFGGYPQSQEGLLAGTWDGKEYTNLGVLLVGAEPAPSPFSKKFKPLAIPRIRGSQDELDKWLREFENYPNRKFVSDGNVETVTIPEGKAEGLDHDRVGVREIKTYNISEKPLS